MNDRTHKTRPIVTRVVAVLFALSVVAAFVLGSMDRGPDKPSKSPASQLVGKNPAAGADVLALLDGLKVGDELGGVRVLAIEAPVQGIVHVEVGTETKAFSVGIGVSGSGGDKRPPVTTDLYEIGYGHVRGEGELPPEALRNTAEAVAERIRRTEHRVPRPQNM